MDENTRKEIAELDKQRSQQELKDLENIAGEGGFKPFGNGKYLFLCFTRGHAPKIETEIQHAYTVGQARTTIKHYLAEGWRIYWRIWGDLYLEH